MTPLLIMVLLMVVMISERGAVRVVHMPRGAVHVPVMPRSVKLLSGALRWPIVIVLRRWNIVEILTVSSARIAVMARNWMVVLVVCMMVIVLVVMMLVVVVLVV